MKILNFVPLLHVHNARKNAMFQTLCLLLILTSIVAVTFISIRMGYTIYVLTDKINSTKPQLEHYQQQLALQQKLQQEQKLLQEYYACLTKGEQTLQNICVTMHIVLTKAQGLIAIESISSNASTFECTVTAPTLTNIEKFREELIKECPGSTVHIKQLTHHHNTVQASMTIKAICQQGTST